MLARQIRGLEKQVKFASIAASAQRDKGKRQSVELTTLQDLHDETVAALNAARLDLDLVSIRPPHDTVSRQARRHIPQHGRRNLPNTPKELAAAKDGAGIGLETRAAGLGTSFKAMAGGSLADELMQSDSALNEKEAPASANAGIDLDEHALTVAIADARHALGMSLDDETEPTREGEVTTLSSNTMAMLITELLAEMNVQQSIADESGHAAAEKTQDLAEMQMDLQAVQSETEQWRSHALEAEETIAVMKAKLHLYGSSESLPSAETHPETDKYCSTGISRRKLGRRGRHADRTSVLAQFDLLEQEVRSVLVRPSSEGSAVEHDDDVTGSTSQNISSRSSTTPHESDGELNVVTAEAFEAEVLAKFKDLGAQVIQIVDRPVGTAGTSATSAVGSDDIRTEATDGVRNIDAVENEHTDVTATVAAVEAASTKTAEIHMPVNKNAVATSVPPPPPPPPPLTAKPALPALDALDAYSDEAAAGANVTVLKSQLMQTRTKLAAVAAELDQAKRYILRKQKKKKKKADGSTKKSDPANFSFEEASGVASTSSNQTTSDGIQTNLSNDDIQTNLSNDDKVVTTLSSEVPSLKEQKEWFDALVQKVTTALDNDEREKVVNLTSKLTDAQMEELSNRLSSVEDIVTPHAREASPQRKQAQVPSIKSDAQIAEDAATFFMSVSPPRSFPKDLGDFGERAPGDVEAVPMFSEALKARSISNEDDGGEEHSNTDFLSFFQSLLKETSNYITVKRRLIERFGQRVFEANKSFVTNFMSSNLLKPAAAKLREPLARLKAPQQQQNQVPASQQQQQQQEQQIQQLCIAKAAVVS